MSEQQEPNIPRYAAVGMIGTVLGVVGVLVLLFLEPIWGYYTDDVTPLVGLFVIGGALTTSVFLASTYLREERTIPRYAAVGMSGTVLGVTGLLVLLSRTPIWTYWIDDVVLLFGISVIGGTFVTSVFLVNTYLHK